MIKYSEELVEKIVKLIEEDAFTITAICEALHITRKSFYQWRRDKPEFDRAIDEAMEHREDNLVELAHSALKKRLEGYEVTEERIIYVPDEENPEEMKVKSKVVRTRKVGPSMAAIRFVLERAQFNRDQRVRARKSSSGSLGFYSPIMERARLICEAEDLQKEEEDMCRMLTDV